MLKGVAQEMEEVDLILKYFLKDQQSLSHLKGVSETLTGVGAV